MEVTGQATEVSITFPERHQPEITLPARNQLSEIGVETRDHVPQFSVVHEEPLLVTNSSQTTERDSGGHSQFPGAPSEGIRSFRNRVNRARRNPLYENYIKYDESYSRI
jgi:hypothetical protein